MPSVSVAFSFPEFSRAMTARAFARRRTQRWDHVAARPTRSGRHHHRRAHFADFADVLANIKAPLIAIRLALPTDLL